LLSNHHLVMQVVRHQIRRNGVHLVAGTARFVESSPGGKIKLAVLLTDPDGELKGIYKHRCVAPCSGLVWSGLMPSCIYPKKKIMITPPILPHPPFLSPTQPRDASLPKTMLTTDKVLIACGTRPVRAEGAVYDGKRVFDSDQLLWGGIDRVPRSFIVVGAGVIGIEYASMINVLPGTNVTVIDPRSQLLGFADQEAR
jgi:hypothetical protein